MFLIVGGFFVLNVFTGVVVDNYSSIKSRSSTRYCNISVATDYVIYNIRNARSSTDGAVITPEQQHWYPSLSSIG